MSQKLHFHLWSLRLLYIVTVQSHTFLPSFLDLPQAAVVEVLWLRWKPLFHLLNDVIRFCVIKSPTPQWIFHLREQEKVAWGEIGRIGHMPQRFHSHIALLPTQQLEMSEQVHCRQYIQKSNKPHHQEQQTAVKWKCWKSIRRNDSMCSSSYGYVCPGLISATKW